MTLRDTSRGLRRTERVEEVCPDCDGTGSDWYGDPEVATQSMPCFRCDGRGTVYHEREIQDPRDEETY